MTNHIHTEECVACWLCDERRQACRKDLVKMEERINDIEECMKNSTEAILKRAARNGWATVGTLITVLLAVLAFFLTDVYRHVTKVDEEKMAVAISKMIDQKVGEKISPVKPNGQ